MSPLVPLGDGCDHTLASLIDFIEAHPSASEADRREMISAIRTLARVLNAEPHMISATPRSLSPLIAAALPVAVKVNDTRWRNVKSLVKRALALVDPMAMPARSRVGLLPEWSMLLDDPAATPLQRGLARFSKYCSGRRIGPHAVDQQVFDGFLHDLTERCILRSAAETHQTAGNAWNTAVLSVPGWPALTLFISNRRKNPSLPWEAFPASLKQDVEAYLTPRSSKVVNFATDVPTMRASTAKGTRILIRQIATAAVEGGVDAATLRTLADLVEPETAQRALEVSLARAESKTTSRIYGAAYLLLKIARYWTKADSATIATLKTFASNLKPAQRGMPLKNRKRLRQFDDRENLLRLFNLPAVLMAEAIAMQETSVAAARLARLAVAIETLTVAPLRISNGVALERGRTLLLDPSGRGVIMVDYTEVKNDVDLEVPLPAGTVRSMKFYLKRFHPLLAPAGCSMLFPSADVGHQHSSVLSDGIRKCIARRCGLEVNDHLFRHIAAKVYLEAHPGDYGTVKLLLGHKSIETTIRTYGGTEGAAAFKRMDERLTETGRTPWREPAPARSR